MCCVLVIEDDPAFREMACCMLARLGHATRQMTGGRAIVDGEPLDGVDVVLTDIFMPDGEGMETIRALRRSHPGVRIVAMSGAADGRDGKCWLSMAEALGADATLPKPFSSRMLANALEGGGAGRLGRPYPADLAPSPVPAAIAASVCPTPEST